MKYLDLTFSHYRWVKTSFCYWGCVFNLSFIESVLCSLEISCKTYLSPCIYNKKCNSWICWINTVLQEMRSLFPLMISLMMKQWSSPSAAWWTSSLSRWTINNIMSLIIVAMSNEQYCLCCSRNLGSLHFSVSFPCSMTFFYIHGFRSCIVWNPAFYEYIVLAN